MQRNDGRALDQLRPVRITPNPLDFAEGSALIEVGRTRVLCAATIEERVPPWLKGKGLGWITAEYAMLPRATSERTAREAAKGRQGGRTHEIQRIVGRSLRAVVDMTKLGERTITIDCDVLQADGGTRTASLTGACVALSIALSKRFSRAQRERWPMLGLVGAVSVGIVHGMPTLDLNYEEDSNAHVDMNVFMTDAGKYVELQGTAEAEPFGRSDLDRMLELASKGIGELFTFQKEAIENGSNGN